MKRSAAAVLMIAGLALTGCAAQGAEVSSSTPAPSASAPTAEPDTSQESDPATVSVYDDWDTALEEVNLGAMYWRAMQLQTLLEETCIPSLESEVTANFFREELAKAQAGDKAIGDKKAIDILSIWGGLFNITRDACEV